MTRNNPIYIGVDIGTQGLRVIAMDQEGNLLSSVKDHFTWTDDIREEQDPEVWWSTLLDALKQLQIDLAKVASLSQIKAISVTSTSGTVIPMDRNNNPLHAALMYSDRRSHQEAEYCSAVSGLPFNASFGLPKMLWYAKHFPHKTEQIHLWCHAADFIIGKLSDVWGVTDFTNALKSGYDLQREEWPEFISSKLQFPLSWMPVVIPPGHTIGNLSPVISQLTGLPSSIFIVTGMTDGCSSQIAAGCVKPGDWNTTIGTTLVIKGVTIQPIHDPLGRVYNHKHPQGYWMPGGASNTGADWITRDYAGYNLSQLNQQAEPLIPTPWLCYPLMQDGERFPFLNTEARGFDEEGLIPEQKFASRLEGVAYLERLSYEFLESLSSEKVSCIYTAGGGSLSDLWLKIRSNVLQKPVYKMKHVEGAVGAAIIAASGTEYQSLSQAVSHMTQIEKSFEPGTYQEAYQENYEKFKALLEKKGYLIGMNGLKKGEYLI